MTAGLTDEQVTHYRRVLADHTTDRPTGTCPLCGVARCPQWAGAYDALAAAGQVMSAEPPPWRPLQLGRKPSPTGSADSRSAS